MTDAERTLDAIRRAAVELLPELTQRLERHGLAEIEVGRGDLRLRVTASRPDRPAASSGDAVRATGDAPPPEVAERDHVQVGVVVGRDEPAASVGVAAPAVGYFVYADGLGPGLEVAKGDAIGHVEMLGVRHDVRAPRSGTVLHLVAESGEAVEYGQVVIEIQPSGDAR